MLESVIIKLTIVNFTRCVGTVHCMNFLQEKRLLIYYTDGNEIFLLRDIM